MKETQKMKVGLVCGASQGIGFAIVKKLLLSGEYKKIYASYRDTSQLELLKSLKKKFTQNLCLIKFNATIEQDVKDIKAVLENEELHLDLCINAIGVLTDDKTKPERRASDITADALNWSFQVNTVPTLLLAKELKNLLAKSDSPVFVAISAKVGSISDNRLGGWYSYRVSKAALNMAIKTFSLEMYRANKKSLVLAIHPGTTDTNLSAPFVATAKKKYILHSPEATATNIINVINSCEPQKNNGKFFSWDGENIPW